MIQEHLRVPSDLRPVQLVLQPSGLSIVLNRRELLLGRHSECDIRLPLPDVSRRHCRFAFTAGRWTVFDLNSLNGIYVNGERVSEAELRHHDVLRVGGFTFVVDLESAVPEATSPAPFDILSEMEKSNRRKAS